MDLKYLNLFQGETKRDKGEKPGSLWLIILLPLFVIAPVEAESANPFSDVPPGFWAESYINAIYNIGITLGCAQDNPNTPENERGYCPEDYIPREQMAAFIVRGVEGEPDGHYCDAGLTSNDVSADMWSCKYIKRLKELGITKGYGDGSYRPYDLVPREQMAAFLVRAVEGEPPFNYCDSGSLFLDVTPDMWSCGYIKRLKELGITAGYADGRYGPFDLVTRAQMAAFLSRALFGKGSPQFRAIGGVSMGAYGAMNIGLSRPHFFNTIASLGGPLDMAYLLKSIKVDMLGNYDNPSAYPNRDTLLNMLKDLTISFGNPAYYNPLSAYYPPGITAQNGRIPTTLLNFKDRELNPDGGLPVITYEDPGPGDWVEILLALDSNGNGIRDAGEPILRQFNEPFDDANGNGIFDAGETYYDLGLDGVQGTGDYGEIDGVFTRNPNHNHYFAEDPLSRAHNLSSTTLQGLNLYIDAGTEDEFQFNIHADHFVNTLNNRGLFFTATNGFPVNFPRISHFNEKRVYVRYPGGHVGFNEENIGLSFEQAKQGVQGAIVVANRFTTLFSFVSDHFAGGNFGIDLFDLTLYPSRMEVAYFTSPSLNRTMKFGIYLPPGYSSNMTNYYPVLYLLLGYNMSVEGMTNSTMKAVLDGLILTGEIQKMIIVIPDGFNYKNGRGHFFVNQIDGERGDHFKSYFFDLITFIDATYKTK
jgi:hypothetical protein